MTARETGAIGAWYFINRLLCTGLHFDNDALRSIDSSVLTLALQPIAAES